MCVCVCVCARACARARVQFLKVLVRFRFERSLVLIRQQSRWQLTLHRRNTQHCKSSEKVTVVYVFSSEIDEMVEVRGSS